MKKIIILDVSTASVHIFPFDENIYSTEDIQEFYNDVNDKYYWSFKESQCSYMILEEDAIIQIH